MDDERDQNEPQVEDERTGSEDDDGPRGFATPRAASRWPWLIGAIGVALALIVSRQPTTDPEVPAAISRIWQLIFGLEDPLGRLINQSILVLFAASLLDLLLASHRIAYNRTWLRKAESGLEALDSPHAAASSMMAFLDAIGITATGYRSLVAQRIRNLFRLRARRVLDVGVLKEISGERVSLHGGFSRFVAGTLTVLGLTGTVLGLTAAIDRLPALAEQVKSSGEIGLFLDQVLQTLGGMKTAFSCTLAGLVSSVVLSVCNYLVQRSQAGFFVDLETFANSELVPAIVPRPADHAAEGFARQLETAGGRLSTLLDRVDSAALVYSKGATTIDESGDNFGKAIEQLTQRMDALAVSAGALTEGTAALTEVRQLPQTLRQVLEEAMRSAAESVQRRQDQTAIEYLNRVESFFREVSATHQQAQQSYADLLIGVQQGVGDLLGRFADRHDEMLRELRSLNDRLAPAPRRGGPLFSGRPDRETRSFWRKSPAVEPPPVAPPFVGVGIGAGVSSGAGDALGRHDPPGARDEGRR